MSSPPSAAPFSAPKIRQPVVGALQRDVEKAAEGALVLINLINIVCLLAYLAANDLAVDLSVALVDRVEANLLEEATGDEESGAVGGAIVFEADLETIAGKLVGGGLAKDAIAVD